MTVKKHPIRKNETCYAIGYLAEEFLGEAGFTAMDIYESKDAIFVDMELAGIDPKNVSVTLHGSKLVIEGNKLEPQSQSGITFYCAERSFGGFRRVFVLTSTVDSNSIEARHKNGILQLKISKTEKSSETSPSMKVKVND